MDSNISRHSIQNRLRLETKLAVLAEELRAVTEELPTEYLKDDGYPKALYNAEAYLGKIIRELKAANAEPQCHSCGSKEDLTQCICCPLMMCNVHDYKKDTWSNKEHHGKCYFCRNARWFLE